MIVTKGYGSKWLITQGYGGTKKETPYPLYFVMSDETEYRLELSTEGG